MRFQRSGSCWKEQIHDRRLQGGSVMVDIVKEGTEFCAKQGKQFELLDSKTEDHQSGYFGGGQRTASAQIYFTCK